MIIKHKDFKQFVTAESSTIGQCMKLIDQNRKGTLFIVGVDNTLLGSLTDGDIRRAFLSGASIDDEAILFANRNPYSIQEKETKMLEISVFETKNFKLIPVCNESNIVESFLSQEKGTAYPEIDNPVILMVGGKGVRLAPLTQNTPKPLLKVGDKPILQTILERLKTFGFKNIYLCTNYLSDHIEDFCGDGSDFGLKIKYFKETTQLGTVGAVKYLEDQMNMPFLVMNGDLLTLLNYRNILDFHIANSSDLTVGSASYKYQVPYGVLQIEGQKITSILEKPHYSFRISGGIYVMKPSILQHIPKGTYFDITDLMEIILQKDGNLTAFPIEEYWLDIGQHKDYEQANNDYSKLF